MKLCELLRRLDNLKRIPRTGWLLCGVKLAEVEDVAQHTFEVAMITLLLAGEIEREGKRLNLEKALSMAILHDWAEAEVADFPYTGLKHLGPKGTKRIIEKRALEDLFRGLPNRGKYMGLWREYGERRTIEARLVHASDYLSMLAQAVEYRERGNRSRELDELWKAVLSDIKPYTLEFRCVKKLVRELRNRYMRVR